MQTKETNFDANWLKQRPLVKNFAWKITHIAYIIDRKNMWQQNIYLSGKKYRSAHPIDSKSSCRVDSAKNTIKVYEISYQVANYLRQVIAWNIHSKNIWLNDTVTTTFLNITSHSVTSLNSTSLFSICKKSVCLSELHIRPLASTSFDFLCAVCSAMQEKSLFKHITIAGDA